MARKENRQEMSGLFDFWKKKKKGPEEKSLFEGLIPALPTPHLPSAPKEKRSLFSILTPKSQLPARQESKQKSPSPFSILAPKREVTERIQAPTPKPMIKFPKAQEEKGEIKDLFKEVLRPKPRPGTTPNRYIFLRPSAPPEKIAIRPYGLPAPASPVMEWTMPTPSQLAEHFKTKMNLNGIWDMIRNARAMPGFREDQIANFEQGLPMILPIDPVVYQEFYTDFANFYGIPWNVIGTYLDVPPARQKEAEESLWNNVLSPLNAMVPEAFEILKPSDLPGFFNVSFTDPNGEYWLYYIEPMFEAQAGGSGGS